MGHAIVDRIGFVDEAVLAAAELVKGSMRLVGSVEELLVAGVGEPRWERAAGSAGNTAAALALLGSSVCFVGKVGDDALGATYRADMGGLGAQVHPDEPVPAAPTGQCLVLVTPDGERTMSTYLGASTSLGPHDLPPDLVSSARMLYVEGYLWDSPGAVEAVDAVLGGPVAFALSLSDPFCVQRHRDAFLDLAQNRVGVLFANEDEILALTGTADIEGAIIAAQGWGCVVAITRGAAGSVVVKGPFRRDVPAVEVAEVVDTTGAGDLYAAGFLHALLGSSDPNSSLGGPGLARCAQLGSVAAAEIVGHVGARPLVSLRSLAARAGLLPPDRGEVPDPSSPKENE
ncbi:MAG: adenosine kinase [Acidimicrobiales bacterium]